MMEKKKNDGKKKVLSIAGSDPSGGAGIQADIKAIMANGAYAMAAITSMTAQNTTGVTAIMPAGPEFLAAQLDAVFSDIFPDAVKIGMVYSAPLANTIADALERYAPKNVVVDPVMVSTSGNSLAIVQAVDVLKNRLFVLADLITPNIPEAESLVGNGIVSRHDMESAARELSQEYGCAVLCKGGHSMGDAADVLCAGGVCTWFEGQMILSENTHGTGCTLSSAIATNLAKGMDLIKAVGRAKDFVTGAIASGLDLGHGNGPTDAGFDLKSEFI